MTAAAPAGPTTLPVVRIDGSTTLRRRVVLMVLLVVPTFATMVATFAGVFTTVFPDVLAATGYTPIVALVVLRSWPPVARWVRHLSATLVGAVWGATAAAVADALVAPPGAFETGAAVVVATIIGLWLAWWAGGLRFGTVGPLVPPPPIDLPPTARSAWSATSMHRPMLVLSLVCLVVGPAILVAASLGGMMLAPVVFVVIAFGLLAPIPFVIRVTVDRRGLRVRSRILGIPLVQVPLERVRSASPAVIDEAEWGSVGSTADPELVAIVHRSGPALVVTRTDGSMVVVTVDRPDEAASTLLAARDAAMRAPHPHG